MKDIKDILKEIVYVPSNSGDEGLMANMFLKELKNNNYEIVKDNMGSVFGLKKSKKPNAKKVVIEAHIDDVGFISEEVNDIGLVKFSAKGGIVKKWMFGHKLRLYINEKKYYDGVVIALSPHQVKKVDPRDRGSKLSENYFENNILVDFGFTSKNDAIEKGFETGLEITWVPDFWVNGDRIFGKGFDNKIGASIVYKLISDLSKKEFDFDLYIGGTTQEEVGLRGAKTSSQMIDADYAVVVDTSPAFDVANEKDNGSLGKGPFLRIMDRGFVTPAKTISFLENISKKNNIKML
ncbi:MAG: hypothetical protein HRS57_02855, partial [Mycoplasmataceae bacterium]|nr:hypothetical protein [Mycoplasmataceae bacterium]